MSAAVTAAQALAALKRLVVRSPQRPTLQVWPVGTRIGTPDGLARIVALDPTSDGEATIVTYRIDGRGFGTYIVEGRRSA